MELSAPCISILFISNNPLFSISIMFIINQLRTEYVPTRIPKALRSAFCHESPLISPLQTSHTLLKLWSGLSWIYKHHKKLFSTRMKKLVCSKTCYYRGGSKPWYILGIHLGIFFLPPPKPCLEHIFSDFFQKRPNYVILMFHIVF